MSNPIKTPQPVRIKSFSRSKLSFHLPYLLQLQKDSWNQLWERDIQELFEEMFPVQDYTGKQFELDFVGFRLEKPKYKTGDEARENNDTFTAPLRVRFVLKNLKTEYEEHQQHWARPKHAKKCAQTPSQKA